MTSIWACSGSAASVYWARYCPLASQVPFVQSCPLVFLLDVMSCVPLSQLFLQIMILFREALYRSREGLDLSF